MVFASYSCPVLATVWARLARLAARRERDFCIVREYVDISSEQRTRGEEAFGCWVRVSALLVSRQPEWVVVFKPIFFSIFFFVLVNNGVDDRPKFL